MAITGDIVKEYLDRFPEVQTMTLARKIYKENKEAFTCLEDVRGVIRYYRGANGKKCRDSLTDKKYIKPTIKNKFNLPPSETESKETYQIPRRNNKILVIGDLHIPYHDVEAVSLAFQYGLEKKVNTVVINGDLFDAYMLSRFEKDPRKRDFPYEIQVTKKFLKSLRETFPDALIIYYLGNHCHRFNKYMLLKAPELLDMPEFQLQFILGCNELNIVYLDNNRGMRAGKLDIRHGHEFYGSGGVFPGRYYYMKAKTNILVNHVHRTSEYIAKDLKKNIEGGFSNGCLCGLDPDYNPTNEYNQGFAYVETFEDGSFAVDTKTIINGRVR